MKLLGRLLALCLGLVTAGLLAAVYLLNAPQGLQWTYRLAAILLPGALSIEHLDGRLVGPFTLRGVRYQSGTADLRIDRFELHWQPGTLVEGRLQIDSLNVAGVSILQTQNPQGSGTLPDIRLPLAVNIDQATLSDLNIGERGKSGGITVSDATLTNAEFKNGRLQLQRLAVTAPTYRFNLSGGLTPRQDYPLDLAVQWSADASDFGTLRGEAQLSGDLQRLQIRHRLTAPVRAELNGTITDALTRFNWQAELTVPAIDMQGLRAQWPALTLGGTVRATGDLRSLQAEGELSSRYQGLRADHRFALAYEGNTLQLRRFDTTLPESGARLELHGTLADLLHQPRAALEGTWQKLRWPLQGETLLHSAAGRFSLSGGYDHYRLQMDGDTAGAKFPAATWSLSADGTPQELDVIRLEGRLLDGSVAVTGKLGWQPQLHWQAAVQGQDLNPGAQWRDWPGRLNLTAQGSGSVVNGEPQLQVELSRLQGQLKGSPVDGDGVLSVKGDRLDLTKLRMDSGDNHFTAAGSLQDTWNLQWQVTAADLDKINIFSPPPPLPPGEGRGEGGRQSTPLPPGKTGGEHGLQSPHISGRLRGSGNISGPRADPLLTASLIGRQLNIADKHIGEIGLVMAVDIHDRVPSVLELELSDATLGDLRLEDIRLRGDGTAQNHRLQLFATAPRSTLAINLDGGYRQGQWTGIVAGLDIDAPYAGHWQLAAPANIALDKTAVHLDELCLRQGKARACTTAQWTAEKGWRTQATVRAVPLNLIKEWLPGGTSLMGSLDADAHAAADADGLIQGKIDARLDAGVAPSIIVGKGGAAPAIVYHRAHLTLTLDEKTLAMRLQTELAAGGDMQGSLDIDRVALPAPLGAGRTDLDTALIGQLRGDVKDLSLLPALIPGVEHTQGRLFTTLTISGSLDKPQIIGELRLENGSAAIPALGINPDAINLVARGDEQGHLRLDAQLRSKGGTLHLGGDLHYDRSRGLNIQAQLNGDKAEIVNTPEYHVLASPNLHLNLRGRRIDLDGELFIPEANLRPRDVSGAVSPSDDVVIVSDEGPPAPTTRWQIYSQLRIRLGDFVKFSGFGLKGLLAGDLTLSDAPQRPTIARGELRITNGEYRAYGQKLTVDRGRLLFFGGPADNPGLDIRAVRQIQDVTAGIMVRGTLKTPQVQIFSEPAMSESDALSYLLIGQPINQATSSQGQQLYGAALSLGLAGSGLLANQIGQRFGIDEVAVESGGTFGGGALVIRHYLSPKLYISYGVGLMERFNIFLMRYQISRRWALEAESGIQSGADVVYTLERK